MIERIKNIIPEDVYADLPVVMEQFKIDSAIRLSHFLGQAAHESGDFTHKVENLNYSAEGLVAVFKKYFPTIEAATPYARNPEKIANHVYNSRMGNGNEASGDAWKFKGRGFFQVTGKNNYAEFDKIVADNILDNPEILSSKYALLSAGWFWNTHKLNALADLGATDDIVKRITKDINGAYNGIDDRILKFNKYYSKLK